MDLQLKIDHAPEPSDTGFLLARLIEYNTQKTNVPNGRELAIFIRDAKRAIAAGIYGGTWGGWLEIFYLWVREDTRGMGIGSRLLLTAEHEAIARGCHHSLVETYDFQAPGFYGKLGYQVFCVLDGMPDKQTRFYLKKKLV